LLGHGGIGEILYYGNQFQGGSNFFRSGMPQSAYAKLLRLCVVIDGTAWYPEFTNTRLYPFGYTSECALADVSFRHELILLNDAVVQRIAVVSNPACRKLALKLILHGHNQVTPAQRTWSAWRMDEALGALRIDATDSLTEEECRRVIEKKRKEIRLDFPVADVPRGETHIAVASTLETTMTCTNHGFKYYLDTTPFTDEAAFFMVFSTSEKALAARVGTLRREATQECGQAIAAYEARLADSPAIRIPGAAAVQSRLRNLPAVVDALEAKDVPGGFRAAAHGYWVWMDLFFNATAFTWANDADSLRDMLRLFRSVADPELGFPKLLTTTLKPLLGAEWVEQCLYIPALYHYYCHTGDRETLAELYPFVTWLMDKCLEKEAGDSGLIEGIGMPDFPMDMDGHDLCSSGNSIAYQALKCLEALAREMGDADKAERYAAKAQKNGESFLKHFYDPDQGYFVDSVSSQDFSKRPHYPVFAILWVSHFAGDLLGGHAAAIAAFQTANFTRPHGIGGMIPRWDTAYPADGNQLIAYYPSWSEGFYRNTMRLAGRAEGLAKWFDDVAWFWNQNTLPEGFTYDAENEGFTVDNPGSKQAFGGQAWYAAFFSAILGLSVDTQGLIISPTPLRRKITVRNLRVRGCRLDVTLGGQDNGGTVLFNRRRLPGPLRALTGTTVIEYGKQNSSHSRPLCIDIGGQEVCSSLWYEVLEPDPGTRVVGTWTRRHLAGLPAITRRPLGKGAVFHVGAWLDDALLSALCGELPLPCAYPDIEGVECIERIHPNGDILRFVINHRDESVTLPLPAPVTDLLRDKAFTGTLTLAANDVAVLV
jgi:hypothetical protein